MKIALIVSITLGLGLLLLFAPLNATVPDSQALEVEPQDLLLTQDAVDEEADDLVAAEALSPEVIEVAYTVAGDGRVYRNEPAQVLPNTASARSDFRTSRSQDHSLGQYPKQDPRDRIANCPDGIALNYEGLELCALGCDSEKDCPDGQKCQFDVVSVQEQGVCLP